MYLKKAVTSKVNCNLSNRQLKKYKIFPPVDYLLAVFMRFANKFYVFDSDIIMEFCYICEPFLI